MAVLIIFAILVGLAVSYMIGMAACKVSGERKGHAVRYIAIGLAGLLLGGGLSELFDLRNDWLSLLIYMGSCILVAFLFQSLETESEKSEEPIKGQKKKESKTSMSKLDYKNLIRIPVWALYSLILATVIMSIVMLVNIWFPDTIDEELIWKIIVSYAVFLISALVIANLTDRIKTMKQFEDTK